MLTKAVAYVRCATDDRENSSIEYQRNAIAEYCEAKKIMLCEEYIDKNCSGTNTNRPEFQRLLRDAQDNHGWDQILVYDGSRFSRNYADAIHYKTMLANHGIKLTSITQNFDSKDEVFIGRTLSSFMDELNSRLVGGNLNEKAHKIGGYSEELLLARGGINCED